MDMSNALEVLSKLQHYGVPTRLLDFSTNYLVALYMACRGPNNRARNGKVVAYKRNAFKRNQFTDEDGYTIYGLPQKMQSADWLNRFIYSQCLGVNYGELTKGLPAHDNETINPEDLRAPLFMEAPRYFQRQIAQSAWYAFFPTKDNSKINICKKLVEMPDANHTFIIKASCKRTILKQLETVGISYATLFPENTEERCNQTIDYVRKHRDDFVC